MVRADAPTATNWVSEATAFWCANIGEAEHGYIGKAFKPAVDRHGWPAVQSALAEYARDPRVKQKLPKYFAADVVRWIEEASDELVVDGVLTAKGQRLMGVPA